MRRLIFIILSVLAFGIFDASFAEFRKGPYLQNVTDNSITICWQTYILTTGTVHYGIGNTDLSVVDTTVTNFHEVKLTGLTAGTEYVYYVEAGSDISAVTTFSTAVSLSTDFRFVAYGDNRPVTSGGDTKAHQAVVTLVESLSPRFIINVGDMYNTNASDDVQNFFDVERELIKDVTLFPARGNHEYQNLTGQPDRFKTYFSLPTNLVSDDANAYYSFNYGNSHFLFINTEIDYSVGGTQYTAIEEDLNNADADSNIEHIFVIMHRPAHSNGSHGGDENPLLSQYFGPLFVAHNVDIVFQGHDHNYERFQPEGPSGPLGDPHGNPDSISEGVTYIVTGGGGAPLSDVPGAPHTETGVTPNLTSQVAVKDYEAMQIDVSGDSVNVIVWSINEDINANGVLDTGEDLNGNGVLDTSSTLDEFTINKSLPSDLYVYSLSAPTKAKAGQTISISDTTANSDTGSAEASTTKFYLSANTTYDTGDTYLGSRAVPSLAEGGSSSGSTSVTIPSTTTAGTYYIIAVADGDGVVTETNEGNNTKYISISIGPDLTISALSAPTTVKRGSTITVSDRTANVGGDTAGASTTKLYLSSNTVYDKLDTYLGGRSVPSLSAKIFNSSSGSTKVTIPSTTTAGTYYIIAVADGDKVVAEANEKNNYKYQSITIALSFFDK